MPTGADRPSRVRNLPLALSTAVAVIGSPHAVHVLVDVAAVGGGEVLLLVDQEQRRVDEVGAGLHRRGIDADQQVDLFLDRHVRQSRSCGSAWPSATSPTPWRRRQLRPARSEAGVGLGDRHGLARDGGHRVGGLHVGGGKALGAVDHHAHADAGRFAVDDVLDPRLAGDHRTGAGSARCARRSTARPPCVAAVSAASASEPSTRTAIGFEQFLGGDARCRRPAPAWRAAAPVFRK